jgi:hypothetical protein
MNLSPSLRLCCEPVLRCHQEHLVFLLIGVTDIQFYAESAAHYADVVQAFCC